jgi:CHAT domain-containing protein
VERYLSDFYTGFDNGKAATHYQAAAKFMVYYYQNFMPLLMDVNRLEMESLFDRFWSSYVSFVNSDDLPGETLYQLQDVLLQLKPVKHLPTINTMTALINRSDEALMENFRQWQSLRNQIVEFEDETIAGQKESDFDMSQSLVDIKGLSDALFPAYSSTLSAISEFSLATLSNQLARDEAAIDFFSTLSDDDQRQRIYFALVSKPGPEVHLVSLQLNQNVLSTNQLQSGTSFYDQIWKPLEAHLSNVKRVYVSKDGALHKVSLQSIPLPSGEMVGESLEILTRINLGALKSSSGTLQDKYLLVGYPASISSDSTSTSAISVPPYLIESPETRKRKPIVSRSASEQEIKVIGNKYAKKKSVTLLVGAEASRSALIEHIQKERPSLLHLAVPLYFNYPDLASDSIGLSILSKNKQVSTGFALAGAANSWKADTLRSEVDNGLLSAMEIGTLDLRNTRLLIWTGAQSTFKEMDGDALYSLQLALKRAGVRSILMNFWDISEDDKDLYMKELYKNLGKGLTVHDALDKTKSKLRKKVDPSVWSGFVLLE